MQIGWSEHALILPQLCVAPKIGLFRNGDSTKTHHLRDATLNAGG